MIFRYRIPLSVLGYGKSCYVSMMSLQRHFWNTLLVALARFERKSGMIHLGALYRAPHSVFDNCAHTSRRTLATDRGFKERVREDMLVRLLDAFVWRSHGEFHCSHHDTIEVSDPCRQARDSATRLYIRPRDECVGCAVPVHNAFRTGSFLLLRKVHRRVLPTICSANSRRSAPWS